MSLDITRVTATARRAATAANHAFVGTEHLLAAAFLEPESPLRPALAAAGVTAEQLAEELLAGLPGAEAGREGPPPLSRFAERVLEDAAKPGGDLLAALLQGPRGRVASVFAKRGLDLKQLRKAAEKERPAPPPKPEPANRQRTKQQKPSRPTAPTAPSAPPPPPAKHPAVPQRPRQLPPHLRPAPGIGIGTIVRWVMLAGVPACLLLRWQGADPLFVFIAASIGMIPLAGFLGKATEQLADRSGPTVGGLLNATFGNAAELIIAFVALRAGMVDLVKASITGSILGNLLLILGLAFFAGGLRAPILKFNRTNAGMAAAMLALAVAGLVFPALFHLLHPGTAAVPVGPSELLLSEAVAIILIVTYLASLLFSLRTHKDVFAVESGAAQHEQPARQLWSVGRSLGVLTGATVAVAVVSELLVSTVEPVTHRLGLSETFLGLVLIPLIGNAAEHGAAVTVARAGKMDLSLQIALGSSTQVALLIGPLLVLAGLAIGQPLSLVFTPLEIISVGMATGVVAIITLDGESHWFEGVQLLALYGMVVAAALFL